VRKLKKYLPQPIAGYKPDTLHQYQVSGTRTAL